MLVYYIWCWVSLYLDYSPNQGINLILVRQLTKYYILLLPWFFFDDIYFLHHVHRLVFIFILFFYLWLDTQYIIMFTSHQYHYVIAIHYCHIIILVFSKCLPKIDSHIFVRYGNTQSLWILFKSWYPQPP